MLVPEAVTGEHDVGNRLVVDVNNGSEEMEFASRAVAILHAARSSEATALIKPSLLVAVPEPAVTEARLL